MAESISSSETNTSPEAHPVHRETILIFGQGPVIDAATRLKASDTNTPFGQEDVNFWSANLAQAAAYLSSFDPSIKQFIIMGGQTGGQQYASEARLIAQKMQELGVSKDTIKLEEMSNDTIENVVNFLNLYESQGNSTDEEYSTLSATYHSFRVGVLMKLFAVPVKNSFHAEEVIRYAARTTPVQDNHSHHSLIDDSSQWNSQRLQILEDQLNINDPTKFTKQKKGTEQRDVADRYIRDSVYTRGLLELPEHWLQYVGKIKSDEKVVEILQQTEQLYPGMLEDKYGIKSIDNISDTKAKLRNISHTPIPEDIFYQWMREETTTGWPSEVSAKFDTLISSLKLVQTR